MICEDQGAAHLRMYELNTKDHILVPLPANFSAIETTSRMLVPVAAPYYGFLVVGDEMISYHSPNKPHITTCIPQKTVSVICSWKMALVSSSAHLYLVFAFPHILAIQSSCIRPG